MKTRNISLVVALIALPFLIDQKLIKNIAPDKEIEIIYNEEVPFPEMGDRPENTKERLKWRQAQKGGLIDPQQVLEARKKVKGLYEIELKGSFRKDAGLSSWFWLGPGNIGGRIRAIAVKTEKKGATPDVIFIGAAAGGIWRSVDEGATWNPINDFLPSLSVTSIVIDPNDPKIMYASTGEGQAVETIGLPGAGIFKSSNGGLSWFQLSSTANSDFFWVNKMAINPSNSSELWAVTTTLDKSGEGTNRGHLQFSNDGGASWTQKQINFGGGFTDIDIHPVNTDTIVASGYGAVFLSTNGGASFSFVTSNLSQSIQASSARVEIAMAKSNPSVMYASADNNGGEVYKSIDGGNMWTLVNIGNNFFQHQSLSFSVGDYANSVWVDPLNENYVLVGGIDLWKSTNGGFTFNKISDWADYHDSDCIIENTTFSSLHADQHIITEAPGYSPTNKRVYIGNDGGIQKTENIQTASENSGWINLVNNSLGITQLYGGGVASDGSVYVGATQDNGFMTGTNPSNWHQPKTGDSRSGAVSHNDPLKVFANTNNNALWKSIDGGDCFSLLFNLNDGADLIAPFLLDPDLTDVVYLAAKRLWKYSDLGGFRIPIKDSLPDGTTITAIDVTNSGQTIWVGYKNGRIERTTDGGGTWSGDLRSILMPNNKMVTDIAIRPTISTRVMVSFAGYSTDNIWYTISQSDGNGGLSWVNNSFDFPLQVNCLSWHPEIILWIYAGTDLGVFASEANGTNWSVSPIYGSSGDEYGNEGPLYTEISELFWKGDGSDLNAYQLCAATFGRGIWKSNAVLSIVRVDNTVNTAVQNGTLTFPFDSFRKAVTNAGNGANIVFISSGDHDEAPPKIIVDKRVMLRAINGPVIIK